MKEYMQRKKERWDRLRIWIMLSGNMVELPPKNVYKEIVKNSNKYYIVSQLRKIPGFCFWRYCLWRKLLKSSCCACQDELWYRMMLVNVVQASELQLSTGTLLNLFFFVVLVFFLEHSVSGGIGSAIILTACAKNINTITLHSSS